MISFPFIQSLNGFARKGRKRRSTIYKCLVSFVGTCQLLDVMYVCLVRNLANKGFAVVGTNILSLSNEEFHRDKWGRGNVATEIWANPCAISSVFFDSRVED